jgi:hypothetical protein
MHASRIPDFANKTRKGMMIWFSEMALRGLFFHPEDRPSDVISGSSGKVLFKQDECAKLDTIMAEMFSKYGDGVCEAAYPIFMKTAGLPRRN